MVSTNALVAKEPQAQELAAALMALVVVAAAVLLLTAVFSIEVFLARPREAEAAREVAIERIRATGVAELVGEPVAGWKFLNGSSAYRRACTA